MKVTFNSWNTGYNEELSELNTLELLDLHHKTRYSRRKNKEGLLEIASKEAHDKKGIYFVTIYDGDIPYCYLSSNNGFLVGFLDEHKRRYLTYSFDAVGENKLFLKDVSYFEYDGETDEVTKHTRFHFTTKGELLMVETNYQTNEEIRSEAKNPIDVSMLWEDYPEFGKYDNLIKLERLPKDINF